MQKKQLLTRLDDRQANELETYINSKSMWSPITSFVEEKGLRNDYTKGDFINFLKEVKEENSMNYAVFSYYSLKNLAEALGIDVKWKFVRRKAKLRKPSDREQQKPTLSAGQVEKMVNAVKGNGYDYEKFFLALSTSYGCRRIELSRVKEKDILKDRLLVRTGKGGEVREQYLPKQIRPIVQNFEFKDRDFTVNILSDVFHDIREKAGVEKRDRMGWHSIRRGLVTEFRKKVSQTDGYSDADLFKFVRWKPNSRVEEMLSIYDNADPVEADREMFEIHPSIHYWEEN
ncbi:hypothetical protein AKJ66_01490 [candidate division MSBL1 archaeon SCGC-AAA259E22]|uniref:Tyr recombinase domain-containing protein n=1 Tax=candidate division MSBL1 archaeon SCGC-AAA259E22 TaxID=1698265 RepID=A0A133UHJ9_9EURY|nr:hypothetical protein AKJ66_01490 [candidate division MSBL1 archaeon SCGC-AAA259E22]